LETGLCCGTSYCIYTIWSVCFNSRGNPYYPAQTKFLARLASGVGLTAKGGHSEALMHELLFPWPRCRYERDISLDVQHVFHDLLPFEVLAPN